MASMRENLTEASHGLWARTAPDAPECIPLDHDHSADIAVIGAGYTGLSAALRLSEGGARVVVLEAEHIGHGGSGRNVGLVNAGMWVMPDAMAARLGSEVGGRLATCLGGAPAEVWEMITRHNIACEAEPVGTLHCAGNAAGLVALRARAAQWQALGAEVRLLDAGETTRQTGSGAFCGALFDPRAGTVQPLGYARGLARAAQAAGAVIYSQSPVRGAARYGNAWRLSTPGGTVTAGRVIVATNAYTSGIWPALSAEMAALPYFNFATVPLPEEQRARVLPHRAGAWDTAQILTSFRLDRAGRLVIGSVGALTAGAGAIHRAWARRRLAHLYPDLADLPFEAGWWGRIGTTSDALPRLHQLAPGIFSLSGYNGRGIAPGTALGRRLAEYLLAGETEAARAELPLPFTPVQPVAFRGLRAVGYRIGSAAWHWLTERG